MSVHMGRPIGVRGRGIVNKRAHSQKLTGRTQERSAQHSIDPPLPSACMQNAETRDRAGDLQIFGLTLSQLSYRGHGQNFLQACCALAQGCPGIAAHCSAASNG